MKKIKLLAMVLLIGTSSFAQCVANFTIVVSPANDGSVSFTSTSTGVNSNTYYSYNFGDGTSSNWSANVTHTYLTGTYPVCLTISDSMGICTSSLCDSVVVINNTPPTCNAYFLASDSTGNTFQFNNYSTGSNLTYFWDLGDGTTSNTSATVFQHTYASPGNYTVCLTVTNTGATCTSTYCDTAIVTSCHAAYTYVLDSLGNGVTFTSTSAGTANTYSWNFDDGTSSNLQNPYHTYSSNGLYYVCLTVSSSVDSTCSDTYCGYVSVYGNCQANFYVNSVVGNIVHLTNYSHGNNLTYLWDYGDGNTSNNLGDSIHTYTVGGGYNICLTVSNSALGCTDTHCQTVYIPTCSASYTFVADSTTNGVSFTAGGSGSPTNYQWTFGDGTSSTSQNPYHVYSSSGNYSVCLTVSSTVDSACYDSFCSTITAGTVCNANFFIIQDSTNLYNYVIYNYSASNGIITSYLWNWGDSTTSTSAYPVHTYNWSIPYQICLTITSANGCTATHCDSIWPGHGVNQIATVTVLPPLTTGIVNQSSITESLDNYPNPFTETTNISYSINKNSSIDLSLFDLLGNKIAGIENGAKANGTYTTTFDAASVSAGIYLLQLKTENKTITKKLVITK
ncbi:MAG: PKD domain-containing protein [Bacteroidota bacterium]